jgi:hypothetical protein
MGRRTKGLLFLLLGAAILVGTNQGALPAELFWVGIAAYPVGGFLFLQGERRVRQEAERRVVGALMPSLGMNRRAVAHADQQLRRRPPAGRPEPGAALDLGAEASVPAGDPDFAVSTDVSFPLEIQERRSIADQLEKLQRLRAEGFESEDEFAAAKAKLLS